MIRTGLALVALAALTLSNGIARADSNDQAFLNALSNGGVSATSGNQSDLTKVGHAVCTLRSAGYSENAVIQITKLKNAGFTPSVATLVIQSAEAAYCPEYIQ